MVKSVFDDDEIELKSKSPFDSNSLFASSRILKVLEQSGKTPKSIKRDKGRLAQAPGKRISKTGKVYWETRKNRSDVLMKDI